MSPSTFELVAPSLMTVLLCVSACRPSSDAGGTAAPTAAPSPPAVATPTTPSASAAAPQVSVAASASAAPANGGVAASSVVGSEGLRRYGGTFVCEERVYPPPPSPHITWWGWAFPVDAHTKYEELARAVAGAERDDAARTLRFGTGAGGRPTIVVSFEDVGAAQSIPRCGQPLPAGAKSRAVVSSMP